MYDAEREVFVTDFLTTNVTAWPTQADQPLTPSVTNTTLYGSPNGFTTKFYKNGSNVNQWCLKSSHFGKFFDRFKGKDQYQLGFSVSIADYKKCTDTDITITNFAEGSGKVRFSSSPSPSKKSSKLWLWVVIVIVVLAVGFGVYWFKFRGDGTGGFSKV